MIPPPPPLPRVSKQILQKFCLKVTSMFACTVIRVYKDISLLKYFHYQGKLSLCVKLYEILIVLSL